MVVNLKLLPRYIITFGVWRGLLLFSQVEWLESEHIRLSGLLSPIRLRKRSTDKLVFREVFLHQSYNFSWNNPAIIIDGGGNIGLTSIFLSMKFPMAKIFSVEPSESNFAILSSNVRAFPNITPVQSALWNKDTTLRIHNLNEHEWAFSVEECLPDSPGAFQAISISSLMQKHNLEYIDILKLDIEGAEKELFSDNYKPWIKHTRCVLIEIHDWLKPGCSQAVFKAFSELNFKASICNGMIMLVNTDLVK